MRGRKVPSGGTAYPKSPVKVKRFFSKPRLFVVETLHKGDRMGKIPSRGTASPNSPKDFVQVSRQKRDKSEGSGIPNSKKQSPGFKGNGKGKRHGKKYNGSGIPSAKPVCPISAAFGEGNGVTSFLPGAESESRWTCDRSSLGLPRHSIVVRSMAVGFRLVTGSMTSWATCGIALAAAATAGSIAPGKGKDGGAVRMGNIPGSEGASIAAWACKKTGPGMQRALASAWGIASVSMAASWRAIADIPAPWHIAAPNCKAQK
jgi:hypothetical protein